MISPEGCASILWKSAEKAPLAAEAMNVSAEKNKQLGLVDRVLPEPLGGAHRDMATMATTLQSALREELSRLRGLSPQDLIERRYQRLMAYGKID